MVSGDCSTVLTNYQANIVIDNTLPSKLKVEGKETLKAGYTQQFCYSCIIKPNGVGLAEITKTKDLLSIVGDTPLDCSNYYTNRVLT